MKMHKEYQWRIKFFLNPPTPRGYVHPRHLLNRVAILTWCCEKNTGYYPQKPQCPILTMWLQRLFCLSHHNSSVFICYSPILRVYSEHIHNVFLNWGSPKQPNKTFTKWQNLFSSENIHYTEIYTHTIIKINTESFNTLYKVRGKTLNGISLHTLSLSLWLMRQS